MAPTLASASPLMEHFLCKIARIMSTAAPAPSSGRWTPGWFSTPPHCTALVAPGVFVLFGEWLYARHTVAYSHLPDYFLAFDLMHAPSGRLLSRREFRRRLCGSGIQLVPTIATRVLAGPPDLRALLDTTSRFAAGPVEGVYVRCDEPPAQPPAGVLEWVQRQAKLVRPDFIQAIEEHWSSRALERNTLAPQ